MVYDAILHAQRIDMQMAVHAQAYLFAMAAGGGKDAPESVEIL